jgi:putative phage-type endonuclease
VDSITIGGSEAAAAVGIDPHKSQVQLWAEKTGKLEPREAGEAALWGTLLEPVVREQVAERGYAIEETHGVALLGGSHPSWMTGHIDGYVGTTERLGVYEGKTCGPWVKGWDDGGVPPPYIIQAHHYVIMAGLSWALIACLVAGQKLELREIERDDALCELIINLEGEFVDHCLNDTPPPPDGSPATTEVLKRLYADTNGEIITLTADDADKIEQLRKVKKSVKLAEEEQARLENELKARLGPAVAGVYEGRKIVSWSPVTSNRFDSTACKTEAPELYERFVRESSYRRFLTHG